MVEFVHGFGHEVWGDVSQVVHPEDLAEQHGYVVEVLDDRHVSGLQALRNVSWHDLPQHLVALPDLGLRGGGVKQAGLNVDAQQELLCGVWHGDEVIAKDLLSLRESLPRLDLVGHHDYGHLRRGVVDPENRRCGDACSALLVDDDNSGHAGGARAAVQTAAVNYLNGLLSVHHRGQREPCTADQLFQRACGSSAGGGGPAAANEYHLCRRRVGFVGRMALCVLRLQR